jgi:hypothetical protein
VACRPELVSGPNLFILYLCVKLRITPVLCSSTLLKPIKKQEDLSTGSR